MRFPFRAIILLTAALSLSGCGLIGNLFRSKPKPSQEGPHDVMIGTVESVNPEQHFVLIRTAMMLHLNPGWKLETRPVSGSKSVLTVTPEQKLNFLSADIVEGFPQKGDVVVMPPQLSTAPAAPSAIPPLTPPGTTPEPARAPGGQELPPPIQ